MQTVDALSEKRSVALPALLGLGAAAAVLALVYGYVRLLSQPVEWLLGIVPDDAFYYLQIARHLAAGDGSTFDGIHPTSGYHPGWMMILVPLATFLRDSGALLRGALVVELLLHAATAVALAGLFRRYASPAVAWIGGLCWFANPLAILLCLQGVESALYALSLVLVVRSLVAFVEASDAEAFLPHLKLGAALALCFLARTEAGILAAVTCGFAPLLRGWRPWDRRALRSAALIGSVFALGIAPWFAWCWIATGSPWQGSGVMKALWAKQLLGPLSTGERVERVATVVGRFWLVAPWLPTLGSPFQGINTFSWAGMAPAAAGLVLAARRAADRPLIFWSVWLLLASVLTGTVYGLFYWDIQVWYRTQPAIVLFVLSYLWIARTGEVLTGRWRVVFRTVVPLLLLALSLREAWSMYSRPPIIYPWQRDFYSSQPELEKHVPPGEAIGCFNAGIPAYFSRRRIVNLDGLVNASVVPYYQTRTFEQYLVDEKIHYIVDEPLSLERARSFMQTPPRLQPLAAVPLHGWPAPVRVLWRVAQ
jgi:hypothetical protein